ARVPRCVVISARPPTSPRFPYTTLFRSDGVTVHERDRRGALEEVVETLHAGFLRGDLRQRVLHHGVARVRTDVRAQLLELRHRRSEEHTSELQSRENLVCRLLLEKQKST